MTMWSSCCCVDPGECQISKTDWDGNTEHTFELKNMVSNGSTVLSKNSLDGSVLAYADYEKKPWRRYRTLLKTAETPCLEVQTEIEWRPSPGDAIQALYMFGQTYDDLEFQPTGQNYRWGGSIDFALQYFEKRVNFSPTNTNVLEKFADASSSPPIGAARTIKEVTIWLAARQNGFTYVKKWQGDAPAVDKFGATGDFFVEGRFGYGYQSHPSNAAFPEELQTGTWIRIASTFSDPGVFLSNLENFPSWENNNRKWLGAVVMDGPGKFLGFNGQSAYTLPQSRLDWCAGAAPIYFGWAVSMVGVLNSNNPATYHVDTVLKQTIRIDRICLTIREDPTPACPCFDTCFEFDWPGGSFSDDFGSKITHTGHYDLKRFVPIDATSLWWVSIYDASPGPLPDWCVFGKDFRVVNLTTNMAALLFVDKATRRALIAVSADRAVFFSDATPNQIVWYGCVNFNYRGGEFSRVGLSPMGGSYALRRFNWSTLADLNDPLKFGQMNTYSLISDSFPNSLSVNYVRCDGSPAQPEVAAGSCMGACVYEPEEQADGRLRWKYVGDVSVNPCDTECACYFKTYPDVSKFGFPIRWTDRLYINCAPRSNHAPDGTQALVSVARNNDWVFSQADFGFVDPNDSPPDQMLAVKITTLSPRGSMRLSGELVTPGQIIPVHDLDAGNFVFRPAPDAFGSEYGVFSFQVIDNGGTDRGGIDTELLPTSFVIHVT